MGKIKKFEDIQSWKKARELTNSIYKATSNKPFNKDFGLRDQIQRSSVSIMANIAEGFDTETDADFIRFLRYGFRSTTEVQSHLYVALDQKYITKDEFNKIYSAAEEVKSLISGFIRYLKS
ncbi:four helix bundle protein [candidate division WOR-3 bacterium]|jgi:four helix bundle protein|nr:four helix bundle protein [candidate division WOR-3 bacterium]